MKLCFDTFASPLGDMTVAAMESGAICLLDFHDCRDRSEALLKRRFESFDRVERENPQDIRGRLANYFTDGTARTAFDGLRLDTDGTPFQNAVWKVLGEIPYGETISYSELARRVSSPRAVRAVGSANGQNPISIVIPCHRVIAKNGTLAGYAGGTVRKQKLLALEGAL